MVSTAPLAPKVPLAAPVAPGGARPRFLLPSVLLTAVLGFLLLVVGGGPGFTLDELALLAQVDSLEAGSWTTPHPYPAVDPDLVAYPDHLAALTDSGFSAYPKHPLVPLVLLESRSVAGDLGPWLVVLLGHVAAAVTIARVVRRVVPRWAMAAFWLAGLGSPLLLHAFVLWMHGWAIALAALATECALVVHDRLGRARLPVGWTAAMLVPVGLLPFVRTEGLLFAGALGGALGFEGLRRRCPRAVLLGAFVVGAGMAAKILESRWIASLVGSLRPTTPDPSAHLGWVQGRVSAVLLNLLLAGYRPSTLLLVAVATTLLLAAGWWCRRGAPGREIQGLAIGGAVLSAVALHLPSAGPVPGFVPGLPLLIVPLLLGRPRRHPAEGLLVPLVVLMLLAVALTAYPGGGGADWGGRYALLCVPPLAALAALRLEGQAALVGRRVAVTVLGALVIATAVSGPAVVRFVGRSVEGLQDQRTAIDRRLAAVAVDPAVDRPVAIAEDPRLGRMLAMEPGRVAGLRAETTDALVPLLRRLDAGGTPEVLLVRYDDLEEPDLAAIRDSGWLVGPREDVPAGVRFYALRRA